jgi:hypothetical protein
MSLLVDEILDCNDVCKVFLSVPLGEDGHVEAGPIRMLDIEAFW